MRYVEVGGTRLSVIGLGTWQFGSREWGYGRDYASSEAGAITNRALDLGINLVDTAELYGFGQSERIVGRALAARRDGAFVATKIAPFVPFEPVIGRRARGSARRLGVDRIDLYQVHWPNPLFPSAPMFHALGRLRRQGVFAHLGVSNHSLTGWRQAERDFAGPVLSNQVSYSLAVRSPETDLLGWAQANDRLIIAYSPLAQGLLSGRYTGSNPPGGVRATNALFLPENLERASGLLGSLLAIAAAHDATASQVALAWLIRRPNVVVIPGASSVAQLESNAAAAALDLTDEEDRELTAASDAFHPQTGPAAVPDLVKARLHRR
ncbi:MAG: aldo/keto reductase [Actinomycetota bacterium]|nr:aldo/keto reductase [Actinomycetota bacterium]